MGWIRHTVLEGILEYFCRVLPDEYPRPGMEGAIKRVLNVYMDGLD